MQKVCRPQIEIADRQYHASEITQPFSLCMICLNEIDTAEQVLTSIAKQTAPPDEIVIIDGGSTDGTFEVISMCARQLGLNVRLFMKHAASPSKARNISIEKAKNEVIAFLDFGNEAYPNVLANLVGPLFTSPDPIVSSGICYPSNNSVWTKYFIINWLDERYLHEFFLPSTKCMATTKAVLNAVGGFPEWLTRSGDDTLVALRMGKLGFRCVLNRLSIIQWGCPATKEEAVKLAYNYGFGDGENGFGDVRWNGQTRPNDIIHGAVYDGYVAGKIKRMEKLALGAMMQQDLYPFE